MFGKPVEMLVPARFRAVHPGLRGAFSASSCVTADGSRPRPLSLKEGRQRVSGRIGLNPIETEQGTMVLSAIVDISDRKQMEAT